MESGTANAPVALVVDDHGPVRRALRERVQVSFSQFQIREAGSVEDALKLIDAEPIDLVILDIGLPGANGIAGTRAIRERSPHTLVVVVSQHDDASHRSAATRAGASAYVCKRACSRELVPVLHRLLDAQAGAAWAAA